MYEDRAFLFFFFFIRDTASTKSSSSFVIRLNTENRDSAEICRRSYAKVVKLKFRLTTDILHQSFAAIRGHTLWFMRRRFRFGGALRLIKFPFLSPL